MKNKNNTTVIIPVFNAEKYIYKTLRSILKNNKVKQIIIVNDYSTDDTIKIIDKFQKIDNRILLLHTDKNSGAGFSRNMAINHIKEHYCCFIDADDMVIENGIDEVTEVLNVHNGDFLVYKWFLCDMYGKLVRPLMDAKDEFIWESIISNKRKEKINPENHPYIMRTLNFPWNKIYKTSFLQNNNIRFSETFVHNDNLAHWMSYAQSKEVILYNRYIIGHKRDRRRVQISTIMDKRRLQLFDAFSDIDIFFNHGENYKNIYPHFVLYKKDLISAFGFMVNDGTFHEFCKKTIETFSNMSSDVFSQIKKIDSIAARDILVLMSHPEIFFKRPLS